MEPDCYLVDVLHYLNPHLIWVRVRNGSSEGDGDGISLEQIGVFGVLPRDMIVNIEADDVVQEKCKYWQPAAAMVMRHVLSEAIEVSFQPVYFDRRSSIFDNNIHKYGEIYITKADRGRRKLSSYLKKSNFAEYNEEAFFQELRLGNISTKLSRDMVDAVMKEIQSNLNDSDSKKLLKNQTTLYRTAKKLETLTMENLSKHNKKMTENDVLNVLDRKFKDLELCKGFEEESAGRATKKGNHSDLQEQCDEIEYNDKKENSINGTNVQVLKSNHVNKTDDTMTENRKVKHKSTTTSAKSESQEDEGAYRRTDHLQYVRKRTINKTKSPKKKFPECDLSKEKYVAYSPPGLDKTKLPIKVVPIHQQTFAPPRVEKEDEELMDTKDDMFGKVDSDIDIEITNKEILKEYHRGSVDKGVEEAQIVVNLAKKIESHPVADCSSSDTQSARKSRLLQRKLKIHNEHLKNCSSGSTVSTTSNKDTSSSGKTKDSDDEVSEIIEQYKSGTVANATKTKVDSNVFVNHQKINVNPFRNVDPNLSIFVDKLVNPVLMVHTKNDARIVPKSTLSEMPFNTNIHTALKNMNVQRPMTMQSISWFTILRGYSAFLIGPQSSGKTMGYLPSVCRLISDFDNDIVSSVGPTCVIVCATARSVAEVESTCRMFVDKARMFSCYAGMDLLSITTSLLNGCELFICTPCVLARLLIQTDFGLDLRRLTTLVLDDCERLDEVYRDEIKLVLFKIKEMLRTRVNKEVKVQYVVVSRVWCDFMEPLAKKAPNTVVCIGAFQECVLYSKATTSVDFVKEENKVDRVLEFLDNNEKVRKTVIVCRKDEEVGKLERILKRKKFIVFACNSEMTVEGLRSMNKAWDEYSEPLCGPILVCCDGNLSHMNVTDAHYLVHFSMPELFSTFCKRFCVLNDHYPSIFKESNDSVAIKIILEDSNAEQLPKICNFVRRCTNEFPTKLDDVCQEILNRKDLVKAEKHVPICGNLLGLGECPDFWYCRERHTSSETTDVPKDWVPTEGIVTFKILHYQTAVLYSARLLSNIKKGGTKKYPQTYSSLSLKMGMYFSQECNQKLHGVPKVGDVCAASIKQNFYVRCQVVDILNKYRTGNPNHVLIKLIDEERLETTRDIYLYHLPKEMREIETYVVQIRLAGVIPKDKDVTFSELATTQIKKAVENNQDLYMRGKVVLTLGNLIFIDNVDVCQDLSSMNEVVVKQNFKELLEPHSEAFPDHITTLKSRLFGNTGAETNVDNESTNFEEIEEVIPVKELIKTKWAQLKKEDMSVVYFNSAIDPGTFFVRLSHFQKDMLALGHDIDKYAEENSTPLTNVKVTDIVLAKHPEDECYERARVDAVGDNKAKCFFVDHGDRKAVPVQSLIEIPHEFITRLPFQAIECRLAGIQPLGEDWTDFSTNWLDSKCNGEDLALYVQAFSSETAKHTGGDKYAVVLIDTSGETDVVYNNLMIDLNLAEPIEEEIDILNNLNFIKSTDQQPSDETNKDFENPQTNGSLSLMAKPIRSYPLVPEDDSDSDRWSVNMPQEFMAMFRANKTWENASQATGTETKESKATVQEIIDTEEPIKISSVSSEVSSVNIDKVSAMSDYEVVAPMKLKVLDSDDSSVSSCAVNVELLQEVSTGRKPKLLWRQNKSTVTIKIMLLGVGEYQIEILGRSIAFSTKVHDVNYNFQVELYGVVKKDECSHTNKGQYIVVSLVKLMPKKWLSLTKGSVINKWIVYDVDSIDTSSDEEETQDHRAEILKSLRDEDSDSDDDLCDDAVYSYTRR